MFSNWKLPFEYHSSKGPVHGENLVDLLISAIRSCRKIGLRPRVVGCDQGSPNQKLYRLLGVTFEHPYFEIGMICEIEFLRSMYLLK